MPLLTFTCGSLQHFKRRQWEEKTYFSLNQQKITMRWYSEDRRKCRAWENSTFEIADSFQIHLKSKIHCWPTFSVIFAIPTIHSMYCMLNGEFMFSSYECQWSWSVQAVTSVTVLSTRISSITASGGRPPFRLQPPAWQQHQPAWGHCVYVSQRDGHSLFLWLICWKAERVESGTSDNCCDMTSQRRWLESFDNANVG